MDRRKFLLGLLSSSAGVSVMPEIDYSQVFTSTIAIDNLSGDVIKPVPYYERYSLAFNSPLSMVVS